MKDEIKEILEYMKKVANKNEEDFESELSHRDCSLLLDHITNLQEENERLKENAIHNDKVVDKAKWNENLYKSRNEKAIEYIKEHIKYECDDTINGMSFYSYHLYDFKKDDLLNILLGDDKDE